MKRFFETFAKSRTRSVLHRLSDKTLADIGIARSEINDHVERIYA